MLYEVELRRHRETHRLLTTGTHQLAAWSSARERRVVRGGGGTGEGGGEGEEVKVFVFYRKPCGAGHYRLLLLLERLSTLETSSPRDCALY